MQLIRTGIPDVLIIEPKVFHDERGWFMESFNEKRFHEALAQLALPIPRPFVQDNHSCSKKGVLRGLHYQRPPHEQGKLVRVVKGRAFDVAVDIRPASATYGQHVSVELSAENKRLFWIPEGLAHGFLALEDDTHFLYKTTDYYYPECEETICYNDTRFVIDWPVEGSPLLNEKDGWLASIMNNSTPPRVNQIDLKIIGDERGKLIALEGRRDLNFDIKRAYYIFDTKPGVVRGLHAHKKLQQLAICVTGQCRMVLDDGKKREDFWLHSPHQGLLINSMIWREMHDFSENCVLLVLADALYDENDYIRDYEVFLKEAVK